MCVAMTPSRLIGNNGQLLWPPGSLSSDMRRFKQITTERKNVIMGRKTWESIPVGFRPLSGRNNIVMSRAKRFVAQGVIVVSSVEEALAAVSGPEVCVIGGGEIYDLFLPRAHKLFVTVVSIKDARGDAYFPVIDPDVWRLLPGMDKPQKWDDRDQYESVFRIYERRK
jgi:dihydrofolate reductase